MANQRLKIGHPIPGSNLLFAEAGQYSITGRDVGLSYTPSGNNDGLVLTNFADYDPDDAPIISVAVNNTLSIAQSTGASVQFANESWWNGTTGVATIYPPTINDGYAGFNNINFWKNATKQVRQVNIRWETRFSDLFCADSTAMPKWIIVRTARSFNIAASLQDRPMLYINHMNEAEGTPTAARLSNVLTFCPAQGTVRMYSTQNFVPGVHHSDIDDVTVAGNAHFPQPFVIRATSGTDSQGNPIIDADEIVNVEMRVQVMSTADEPDGFIGMRITRRNGQILERGTAWNYWPVPGSVTVNTNYIADVDVMGGGYFNNPNDGNTGRHIKVGRMLTFGTNLSPSVGRHWIGPPLGFVNV